MSKASNYVLWRIQKHASPAFEFSISAQQITPKLSNLLPHSFCGWGIEKRFNWVVLAQGHKTTDQGVPRAKVTSRFSSREELTYMCLSPGLAGWSSMWPLQMAWSLGSMRECPWGKHFLYNVLCSSCPLVYHWPKPVKQPIPKSNLKRSMQRG